MASGTLAHFGFDPCFRLRVLESAGFHVADCGSLESLSAELQHEPDALVLEEEPVAQVDQAIFLCRSFPTIPLIFFQSAVGNVRRSTDLIIPSFTPPELWLHEIRDLIQRAQAVTAESKRIRASFAALVVDCTAVKKESARLLEASGLRLWENRR